MREPTENPGRAEQMAFIDALVSQKRHEFLRLLGPRERHLEGLIRSGSFDSLKNLSQHDQLKHIGQQCRLVVHSFSG
jgi:hypothetical protein